MTRAARRRAWRSQWREIDWGEALRQQAGAKANVDKVRVKRPAYDSPITEALAMEAPTWLQWLRFALLIATPIAVIAWRVLR